MTLGGHRAARAGAAEPRSILITGGAQGLGAAMVRLFTAAGYQVAVTGIAPATDPYYSAAKDALIGLTRWFALILQKDTITVNAICPGFIHTPLTATVREKTDRARNRHRRRQPRRHRGRDRAGLRGQGASRGSASRPAR